MTTLTPEDRERLRENAAEGGPWGAVVLALLDALDRAKRERDEWEQAANFIAACSNEANADLHDTRDVIERVRDLHRPETGIHGTTVCAHRHCTDDSHDQCEYPCATVRALDGGGES